MTNQGYRLTSLGLMLSGFWFIITGLGSDRFNPTSLLIVGSMALCFFGWAVQSRMFSKLTPEMQIEIGYASRDDFINENGILKEKPT